MVWVLGGLVALVVALVVFFQIPYSPTKSTFLGDVQHHTEQAAATAQTGVFAEKDIEHLPEPVQNHFRAAGWIGQPIMESAHAFMPSVLLYQSRDSSPLILDYDLHVYAHPARLAYMNSSLFGIPFEAYDSTQEGTGFMRGVVGKTLTLFNVTGPEMDQGQIITWLAEAPLLPTIAISEYVAWEPVDAKHAKATVSYKGLTCSGVFTFGNDGFFKSFHTDERARVGTDGSVDYPGWTSEFENWKRDESGVYTVSSARVVWHLEDGDLAYFASNDFDVAYQ